MEATKSRILKVKELTVKKAKAKPKILTEKKFKQTLQQNKQFKEGVYIKYKKQGYYTKNYRQGQRTNTVKGISISYNKEKLKGIREYIIKSFIFCYNNYCLIYQESKYSTSYWL